MVAIPLGYQSDQGFLRDLFLAPVVLMTFIQLSIILNMECSLMIWPYIGRFVCILDDCDMLQNDLANVASWSQQCMATSAELE